MRMRVIVIIQNLQVFFGKVTSFSNVRLCQWISPLVFFGLDSSFSLRAIVIIAICLQTLTVYVH